MDYYDANLEGKMKKITYTVVITAIILFLICFAVNTYVEMIEVKELGKKFLTVFWTNFTVRSVAQIISFVLCFVMFYISTVVVARVMRESRSPVLSVIGKPIGRILICILLSIIASTFISETVYSRYLMFVHSTPFGITDPIFGNDVGYYIFQRPFIEAVLGSLSSVWVVVGIYCAAAYAVIHSVNGLLDFGDITSKKKVVYHNIINVAIWLVIHTLSYKYRSEGLLYSTIGEFSGAGYTEINIWYNFNRIAPFLIIAVTVAMLFFMFRRKYKAMLLSVAIYPIVLIIVAVVAFGVQKLVVAPNEAVKELPYIQHNINYTKMAYGIDDVAQYEYPADNNLTSASISEKSRTFDSIRIVDFNANITAVNSLQSIRNYYKFNDSDVTRYNINGVPTLVTISPREIDKAFLPETAKSYANEKFRFTHGFGVVMNPLNKVTDEGQPEFYIKDIPSVSAEGVPQVTQPRIYYGEMDDSYVVVNSNLSEIDYYEGSEEVSYNYEGNGGIPLNFMNKVIYSFKNADFRLLISQYVNPQSRILINRNVRTRVSKAAPFIMFDADPYMVIDGSGNLKWVIDGYTTSIYYPYSQGYNGYNYIRNSVKAVVDAYNGDIELYVADKTDPMIQTYMKMYPGVFNEGPIPQDISEHIVYPEYLFTVQAQVYAKYHVANPNTIYNKSDLWAFSKEKYGAQEQEIVPYYNLMNVSELSDDEDFIIMVPYTLANKDNMVAWLAAGCDGENYGKLISYHFPKGRNVYGTMQIENRIDSDPAISREMTLWGQGGSNVIRGNTLVVPIGGSIIYIEPIYISSNASSSTNNSIPGLKRIIVAYGDKIVMKPTLDEALYEIFGSTPSGDVTQTPEDESTPSQPTADGITVDMAIDKVIEGYNNVKKSTSDGDWNGFGTNMAILDEAIAELEKLRSGENQ